MSEDNETDRRHQAYVKQNAPDPTQLPRDLYDLTGENPYTMAEVVPGADSAEVMGEGERDGEERRRERETCRSIVPARPSTSPRRGCPRTAASSWPSTGAPWTSGWWVQTTRWPFSWPPGETGGTRYRC